MQASQTSSSTLARPPTGGEVAFDRGFRWTTVGFAVGTMALLAAILVVIGLEAVPAMGRHGADFLGGKTWDPGREEFGILPEIAGTLYTSIIALLIGGFLGITTAIFLSQHFLPRPLETVMKNIIELLAAIPSVVYGLWGIFVVVPLIRPVADWIHAHLGGLPFFSTRLSSFGILPAALVLAIMILPTVTAISREALAAVPSRLHQASFGMGATRWQTIFKVVVPTASTGIFGSLVLGFGRAVGETMALAMLVGNSNVLSWSVFSPGITLASRLASQFPEAGAIEIEALMYAAFVLLVITLLVNVVGSAIMARASAGTKGLR